MAATPISSVPLFDAKTQVKALAPYLEEACKRTSPFGPGHPRPEVVALEREVADYCGAASGRRLRLGHRRLSLACHALDVGPGDEVIVPPFTFFATAGAVCRAGAGPVFADIDPTPSTSTRPGREQDHARTRADHAGPPVRPVLPTWSRCGGSPSGTACPIIEDAAQAFGAEYQGKRTGTLGASPASASTRPRTSAPSATRGMVVTNDPDWAANDVPPRPRHGSRSTITSTWAGTPALDAMQAAILVKLPYVDQWATAGRRANGTTGCSTSMHRPPLPEAGRPRSGRHTFNQYVVRVRRPARRLANP